MDSVLLFYYGSLVTDKQMNYRFAQFFRIIGPFAIICSSIYG